MPGRTLICDGKFQDVHVTEHALDIAWQDQHTPPVDLFFAEKIDDIVLTIPGSLGGDVITIDCDTLPVAGNCISLRQDGRYFQSEIRSFTGTGPYLVTLDTYMDYAYGPTALGEIGSKSMAVDGSITPRIFRIRPPVGISWDINAFVFYLEDGLAMDTTMFGSIVGGLENGILLRLVNGIYTNYLHIKNNGDFYKLCNIASFDSEKTPTAVYNLYAKKIYNGVENHGVSIRLDGDDGDELQIIISDDLTDLILCESIVQGHRTTG